MSNSGSLTFTGTTNTITLSGTIAGSIMMSSSTATSITLQGNTGGIFLTGASSSITVANTSASAISVVGGINTNSGYYLNGSLLTFSSLPTTLGLAASSQCLSMDSNGVSRIPSGSLTTNQLKFYNNTSLRTSIRLYRASDTTPLVIADQIDGSTSTNRQYPIVSVISCVNTSQPVAGISATTASLMNVQMNDINFGTINYDVGFSVGYTQPYATGYPNTQTIMTNAVALNISANSTNPLASTGNFLINGNTSTYLMNTLTPISGFNLTLNGSACISGNLRATGYLQIGSSTDTSRLISALNSSMGTSTSAYVCFGQSASAANQAELSFYYAGSGSSSNRFDIGFYGGVVASFVQSGRFAIGSTSPRAPLDVVSTVSYQAQPNTGIQYGLLTAASNTFPTGPSASYNTSAVFTGALVVASISVISDRRLKRDIEDIPSVAIDAFEKLDAKVYRYKSNLSKVELGFIAQDLIKAQLPELVHMIPNENLKKESQYDLDGVQLQLNYEAMIPLLQCSIKRLIAKVDILVDHITQMETESEKQEARIKYLESIISDQKCRLI